VRRVSQSAGAVSQHREDSSPDRRDQGAGSAHWGDPPHGAASPTVHQWRCGTGTKFEWMGSLHRISNKEQALANMQRAAEEAAGALREVCMVLDGIALDMSFARHASRMPLRLSSDRLENIARTLVGEARARGPVGAKHASIVGKVALAAASISVILFAEDAGQVAMNRFKASHERASRNLELVDQYAESAQSETRQDLNLQITALFAELDHLASDVGGGVAEQRRRELEEAMTTRQLPASGALQGLDHVIGKLRMGAQQASVDEDRGWLLDSTGGHWEKLAEIEFRIAEIFAQLTGDTPL
jgi:hypothetical protein